MIPDILEVVVCTEKTKGTINALAGAGPGTSDVVLVKVTGSAVDVATAGSVPAKLPVMPVVDEVAE